MDRPVGPDVRPALLGLTLALTTLAARCIQAALVVGAADIYNWYVTATMMMEGRALRIYDTGYVNWPPFMQLSNFVVLWLSRATGLSYFTLFKWPSILADAAISCILFTAALKMKRDLKTSFLCGLAYALSPISILVTSVHGQVDAFVALFCLLSWYFYAAESERRSLVLSALFLGLGVATKSVPILFLPLFLMGIGFWKKRLLYILGAVVPAFVMTLPYYLATPESVMNYAVRYSSRFGSWGIPLLLAVIQKRLSWTTLDAAQQFYLHYGKYILIIGLLLFYVTKARRLPFLGSFVGIFSIFYCLAPGFGYQYLLWIVPFALLEGHFPLLAYTVFASGWMLICYLPVISPSLAERIITCLGDQVYWRGAVVFSLFTWGTCVIGLIRNLRTPVPERRP
jgi:4-amino-4-deoxy-L-arabinose transferase-like glycosyltransferase